MVTVYRIDKVNIQHNEYSVDRNETWYVVKDKDFVSFEDAKEYVIRMNNNKCGYDLGILYSKDEAEIAYRCFDKEFCHRQQYFIGKPDVNLIKSKLQNYKIRVTN
jgi:hypothetical protein